MSATSKIPATKTESIDALIPDEGTPNRWGGFDYDGGRVRTVRDDIDVQVFTFTPNMATISESRFSELVPDLTIAVFVNSLIARGGM